MKKISMNLGKIFLLLFCLFGTIQNQLQAQITKAYTKIQTQASAVYFFQGQEYTTETNLVITQVLPLYSVSVSPDGTAASPGQIIYGLRGTEVSIPYKVMNNGNDTDSFELDVMNESEIGRAHV